MANFIVVLKPSDNKAEATTIDGACLALKTLWIEDAETGMYPSRATIHWAPEGKVENDA